MSGLPKGADAQRRKRVIRCVCCLRVCTQADGFVVDEDEEGEPEEDESGKKKKKKRKRKEKKRRQVRAES